MVLWERSYDRARRMLVLLLTGLVLEQLSQLLHCQPHPGLDRSERLSAVQCNLLVRQASKESQFDDETLFRRNLRESVSNGLALQRVDRRLGGVVAARQLKGWFLIE